MLGQHSNYLSSTGMLYSFKAVSKCKTVYFFNTDTSTHKYSMSRKKEYKGHNNQYVPFTQALALRGLVFRVESPNHIILYKMKV